MMYHKNEENKSNVTSYPIFCGLSGSIFQSSVYLGLIIAYLDILEVLSKINILSVFESTFIYQYEQRHLLKLLLEYYYNDKLLKYEKVIEIFNKNKSNYSPKEFIIKLFTDFGYFKKILSIKNNCDTNEYYDLSILYSFKNSKCLLHWIKILSRKIKSNNNHYVHIAGPDLKVTNYSYYDKISLGLYCCDFNIYDLKKILDFELLTTNPVNHTFIASIELELLLRKRVDALIWLLNELLARQNKQHLVSKPFFYKLLFYGLLFHFAALKPNEKWLLEVEKFRHKGGITYQCIKPSFYSDLTYYMINDGLDIINNSRICQRIMQLSDKLLKTLIPRFDVFLWDTLDEYNWSNGNYWITSNEEEFYSRNKLLSDKICEVIEHSINS